MIKNIFYSIFLLFYIIIFNGPHEINQSVCLDIISCLFDVKYEMSIDRSEDSDPSTPIGTPNIFDGLQSASDRRLAPREMSSQSPYQPPSAVVGPAFSELLHRMRRARVRLAKTEQSPQRLALQAPAPRRARSGLPAGRGAGGRPVERGRAAGCGRYGVEERQRVIERTLTLVFAQWALHRFAVRHIPSRGLRVLYVGCCVVGTLSFIQTRAKTRKQ